MVGKIIHEGKAEQTHGNYSINDQNTRAAFFNDYFWEISNNAGSGKDNLVGQDMTIPCFSLEFLFFSSHDFQQGS